MKYRLVWKYWNGVGGCFNYGHEDFESPTEDDANFVSDKIVKELRANYYPEDTEFVLYQIVSWKAKDV